MNRALQKVDFVSSDNCVDFGRMREARALVDSAVCIYETRTGKSVTRRQRTRCINAMCQNPAFLMELLTGQAFEGQETVH